MKCIHFYNFPGSHRPISQHNRGSGLVSSCNIKDEHNHFRNDIWTIKSSKYRQDPVRLHPLQSGDRSGRGQAASRRVLHPICGLPSGCPKQSQVSPFPREHLQRLPDCMPAPLSSPPPRFVGITSIPSTLPTMPWTTLRGTSPSRLWTRRSTWCAQASAWSLPSACSRSTR